MKLSGHVTIEKINEITGEILETIEQDNLITDIAYQRLAGNSSYEYGKWMALRIFISNETAAPVRAKTSIQCMGTAYQGTGQPPIQPFQNANPPYFVITQRFDSVVTGRTFSSVGLTEANPGQVVNTTVEPWAYLLLNTPCTQEANQVLNITYRITIEANTNPNLLSTNYDKWNSDLCMQMVYGGYFSNMNSSLFQRTFRYTTCNAPLKEYGWKYLFVNSLLGTPAQTNFTNFTPINTSQDTLFYRTKQSVYYERANAGGLYGTANGKLINGLLFGVNGVLPFSINTNANNPSSPDLTITDSAHYMVNSNLSSNLQSAFSYSAIPRDDIGPMFLPDNNPSGNGQIQFSEDPWTGIWPSIYRIRITEGGTVGTAKYVLGVKRYTGFMSDATFVYANCTRSFHPYVIAYHQPYTRCHGWQLVSPILAWDAVWTVQYDANGVSLINQFTGQHYDFDSVNGLNITNARQVALDVINNYIYVACSATGLWRIDITNKASAVITNLSTTPTYAVDVSSSGVVYVFMNITSNTLTLTSSASSYVTNLNFTGVALTTTDWLNIYVNKIHADTRIAISVRSTAAITNGLRASKVYWWDLVNGTRTNHYTTDIVWTGEIQTTIAWVNNSDNRMWAAPGHLLQFNNSSRLNPSAVQMAVNTYTADNRHSVETRRVLDGTILASGSVPPPNVCQDKWGYLLPIITSSSTQNLYNPSTGAVQYSYNQLQSATQNGTGMQSDGHKRVALTNGIVLSDSAMYFIFNNGMNNDINKWVWYKWNGTSWIESITYNPDTNVWTDTTGTDVRTTSNTFQDLIEGINVRFINGASEPSFVLNEVYDQYVGKGILKTNDIDLYVESVPFYSQPVYDQVALTDTVITLANNHGVVLDGAPGNTGLSSAASAITVNPLWHSVIPEYEANTMRFTIDNIAITRCFSETIDTIPAQNTLTTGQIILYRNGLILCSTADVNKTLRGYFSYVAKSD